jgi:ketosteroid isomerase-like protein
MSPEDLARTYYRLFNERRLDEAGALVDPQASFHYIPTCQRLVGRAGYRALAAAWVIAFEDAEIEITSVHPIDAETVRVEFIGRGTHTGDLVLGDALTIPATGQRTELAFSDTIQVRDGLIAKVEFDFDVEELKRKLAFPAGAPAAGPGPITAA